jgi:hypothetical protein
VPEAAIASSPRRDRNLAFGLGGDVEQHLVRVQDPRVGNLKRGWDAERNQLRLL